MHRNTYICINNGGEFKKQAIKEKHTNTVALHHLVNLNSFY
jgi:hypothetical protein